MVLLELFINNCRHSNLTVTLNIAEKTIFGPSYPPHYYPPTSEAYTSRQTSDLPRKRSLDQSCSNNKENVPKKQKLIYSSSSAPIKKRPFEKEEDQQDTKPSSSKKQKIIGDFFSRLAQPSTIVSASKIATAPNMKQQAKPINMNMKAALKKAAINKINFSATMSDMTNSRKPSAKPAGFVYRIVRWPIITEDLVNAEFNTTVEEPQESPPADQKQPPKQEPTQSTGRVSDDRIKKDDIPCPPYMPFTPPHQIMPDWFFIIPLKRP